MTLTEQQILGLNETEALNAVLPFMNPDEWRVLEASGYSYEPGPDHLHATVDGSTWLDVDVRECDCGNDSREAHLVLSLMSHAAGQGITLSLAQLRARRMVDDPQHTFWHEEPAFAASASVAQGDTRFARVYEAPSAPLALMQVYLLAKHGYLE